jgi:chemotaxis protein MotB
VSGPDPFTMHDADEEDLWLVSYADLLTLLVAFFVLLVAASPINTSALEAVASSLGVKRQNAIESLRAKVDKLISDNALTGVQTIHDAEGLGIELRDTLLFDSGSAELRPEAGTLVGRLATLLGELPDRPIIVEGHTDDVPIRTALFRSNWELGSARAIRVLESLQAKGIARERMSARSFADNKPPAQTEGSLEERRASSRRVVIRVE